MSFSFGAVRLPFPLFALNVARSSPDVHTPRGPVLSHRRPRRRLASLEPRPLQARGLTLVRVVL
jgi:hypothetical protein